jgi:ATP-dependent Clp protease ATP-binding subunit ClpC
MPKINVYLPDELADAVRTAGLSVSPICQRALEHAVRQLAVVRAAATEELGDGEPAMAGSRLTDRSRTVLRLAIERARDAGEATVSTARLLEGILAEGSNLAIQVLDVLEIRPEQLTSALAGAAPVAESQPAPGDALRFSGPAGEVLRLAVTEALGLGHNYVGCEHLLLGLVAEPDGAGGEVLRAAGADPKATRRSVAAAMAGYRHLAANQVGRPASGQLTALLQEQLTAQLQPLVTRIENLEARLN